MQAAVIQMLSVPDLASNLRQAQQLLIQARQQGAQLAVLPENFATFGMVSEQLMQAASIVQAWAQQITQTLGLWLVAGSVPVYNPTLDKYWARCWLFNAQGQIVSQYDKQHLFDATVLDQQGGYRESATYCPGDSLCVVSTPIGRLGLGVCYDLRFPELFAELRRLGAECIALPSAFTQVTGAAHWEVLVRARAIETQCYLLAAGQGGDHSNGRQTFGHSLLVSPWGEVLQQASVGEAVLVADCDLDYLHDIRQRMPVVAHKKTLLGSD